MLMCGKSGRSDERRKRRKVGSESNGAVYGLGLFCTSKYIEKEVGRGRQSGEGGVCCRPFDCHCFS